MRICHVSTRLILGGSQENTVLSCETQARRGHDVSLLFGPIHGPEGTMLPRAKSFRTREGRGIETVEIPNLVREVSPLRDLRARRELMQEIERLDPDVVHTHSSNAGVLGRDAAWALCARRGRPAVVHTVHGPPFMPVEGGALKRLRVRAINKAYELAEKRAAKRCHAIVSVADAMTAQFLARGIGTPELFTTVRSGTDLAPYDGLDRAAARTRVRAELGIDPGAFVIVTVARLAQHKGHDDLLDAMGASMRADPRITLLWIGDGWWRGRLLSKAAAMGLERQIKTTGLVPPERVPELVCAADVLAHPSYREGLPRTVVQALLCGVCPVAYDCDGTGEAVREMQTGRLVRTGDAETLRVALLWVRDNPQRAAEFARAGEAECRRLYSAEAMCDGLEAVYARAIERAGVRT